MLESLCYCTQARRAARSLTQAYDKALEPVGLKATQFSLLRFIDRLGLPTITEVSEATGLDRSTLGRNLKVIEKSHHIAIQAGTDGREKVIVITDIGRVAINEATPIWEALQDWIKDNTKPKDLDSLRRLNKTFEGLLDQAEQTVL